jgi:hypothetical protein
MSEGEIATLRREIRDLSEKSDRQHMENRQSQAADRETFRLAIQTQQQTFAKAMDEQRNAFQEALNRQFLIHTDLDKRVERHTLQIENCIGDGKPGDGRVGALENAMETMKKFRWQAIAAMSVTMWLIEVWRRNSGH